MEKNKIIKCLLITAVFVIFCLIMTPHIRILFDLNGEGVDFIIKVLGMFGLGLGGLFTFGRWRVEQFFKYQKSWTNKMFDDYDEFHKNFLFFCEMIRNIQFLLTKENLAIMDPEILKQKLIKECSRLPVLPQLSTNTMDLQMDRFFRLNNTNQVLFRASSINTLRDYTDRLHDHADSLSNNLQTVLNDSAEIDYFRDIFNKDLKFALDAGYALEKHKDWAVSIDIAFTSWILNRWFLFRNLMDEFVKTHEYKTIIHDLDELISPKED